MLTGRTFAKRLPLTVAFTVLLVAAFGAGCNGFFTDPTLNSIAIQPPTPQVQVGQSTTLQAWGTYSDNTRSQIKSGVVWTSSDPSAVAIDPKSGQITGEGTGGTSTVTAAAQGLSGTAMATAFLGTITNFKVCLGTFSATTCPTPTWNVSSQSGGMQAFVAVGTNNNQVLDLTTASTWAVTPTPGSGSITCTDTGASPETCSVTTNTTVMNGYVITVTYGTTNTATGTINVGP